MNGDSYSRTPAGQSSQENNTQKNDLSVNVWRGWEHRTRPAYIYDKNEFFYAAYQQAARAVTEITENSYQRFMQDLSIQTAMTSELRSYAQSRQPEANLPEAAYNLLGYPNNIVAFCAHRGQGKSSAMLSMAESLKQLNVYASGGQYSVSAKRDSTAYQFWQGFSTSAGKNLGDFPVWKTEYIALDPIDPTMMEKNDSILRTIISKMFTVWEAKTQKENNYWQQTKGRNDTTRQVLQDELLQQFLKCFRSLDAVRSDSGRTGYSRSVDELSQLAETGDSANLKHAFLKLVTLFLQYMTGNQNNHSMLVIQIDDADLNTRFAYDLTEEIRKYCVVPRVLILMALHVGTMSRIIEQHFMQQYKLLIKQNCMSKEKCHEIMSKYMEKLLPTTHRVYLPEVDSYLRDSFRFLGLSYFGTPPAADSEASSNTVDLLAMTQTEKEILLRDDLIKEPLTYQNQLILQLYRKTGIILVAPENRLHDFLPSNLRELGHFLRYLDSMEDVIPDDRPELRVGGTFFHLLEACNTNVKPPEYLSIQLRNLQMMEQYLLNDWCSIHLEEEQEDIIRSLSNAPIDRKNRILLDNLEQYCLKKEKQNKPLEHVENGMQQYADEASFVDVQYALYNLKHMKQAQEEYLLIYAIQFYYTIYTHILVLQGIQHLYEIPPDKRRTASPFQSLTELIGYRLFPELFYEKKKAFNPYSPLGISTYHVQNSLSTSLPDSQVRYMTHFCYLPLSEGVAYDATRGIIRKSETIEEETNVEGEKPFTLRSDYNLLSTTVAFDLLRPILTLPALSDFGVSIMGDGKESKGRRRLIATCLTLICNTDLQETVYHQYFRCPDMVEDALSEKLRQDTEFMNRMRTVVGLPNMEKTQNNQQRVETATTKAKLDAKARGASNVEVKRAAADAKKRIEEEINQQTNEQIRAAREELKTVIAGLIQGVYSNIQKCVEDAIISEKAESFCPTELFGKSYGLFNAHYLAEFLSGDYQRKIKDDLVEADLKLYNSVPMKDREGTPSTEPPPKSPSNRTNKKASGR